MPVWVKALYVGVIVATVGWAIRPSSAGSSERSTPSASERARSYGEIIAAEMEGHLSPDLSLVRRFEGLIENLDIRCAGSRESISDQILAGHRTFMSRGGKATLLDVAVGWERATRGMAEVGVDCTQMLAGVLVLLEKD